MELVSLEEQAAVVQMVVNWQLRRISPQQQKALLAAENTLRGMAQLRRHLQGLEADDEGATDRLSEELLRLLKISSTASAATPASE